MASDPKKKDLFDFDLPEGLDDDLGGDWESAFQAEDFMLSPDEEGEISTGQQAQDDMNLAALLEEGSAEKTTKSPATVATDHPPVDKPRQPFRPAPLLTAAILQLARCRTWYGGRPRVQKILLPAFCLLPLVALAAVLFFRTTTNELQLASEQKTPPATVAVPFPAPDIPAPLPPSSVAITPPPDNQTVLASKNRKKWSLPGFFITTHQENNGGKATISVDLTLVLLLDPGQPLPEGQKAAVRDAIYQFYSNRPPEELRRYALARGEMIRNLESWLKKAWPDGPLASIIFDSYRVISK
ncbi:MAG: hypothetical protein ACOY4H_10580 [Thermodesulfobacteriota bacterium]